MNKHEIFEIKGKTYDVAMDTTNIPTIVNLKCNGQAFNFDYINEKIKMDEEDFWKILNEAYANKELIINLTQMHCQFRMKSSLFEFEYKELEALQKSLNEVEIQENLNIQPTRNKQIR